MLLFAATSKAWVEDVHIFEQIALWLGYVLWLGAHPILHSTHIGVLDGVCFREKIVICLRFFAV